MTERELWDEIGHLERSMKAMYESLDRISEGCSNPDAEPIRVAVYAMKIKLERAFEAKFPLVTAIKRYFG